MLHLAGPREALAGHHVLDLDRGFIVEAEFPQRHFEVSALRVVRIEIDGEQEEVAEVVRGFAVIEDVVVPGVVELDVGELLQGGGGMAQRVDAPDVFANVRRVVPVPRLQLILLGIGVFLLAGKRRRLAQLEAAVDAVVAAEARRQNEAHAKARRGRLSADSRD